MARNKASDPVRDEQCYRFRAAGLTFSQIAVKMDLNSMMHARQCVHRWGKEHRIAIDPAPPKREPGADYYAAREAGLLWREIGELFNVLSGSAHGTAQAYAERHGLPWPLEVDQT